MSIFKHNLSKNDIKYITGLFRDSNKKLDLTNPLDYNLFKNNLLVTNHEDLITEYIENLTIWVFHIKKYQDMEDYEMCDVMYKTIDKIQDKYLGFIEDTIDLEGVKNTIINTKPIVIKNIFK